MGEVFLQTYVKLPAQFSLFSACMPQVVTEQAVTAIWGTHTAGC